MLKTLRRIDRLTEIAFKPAEVIVRSFVKDPLFVAAGGIAAVLAVKGFIHHKDAQETELLHQDLAEERARKAAEQALEGQIVEQHDVELQVPGDNSEPDRGHDFEKNLVHSIRQAGARNDG